MLLALFLAMGALQSEQITHKSEETPEKRSKIVKSRSFDTWICHLKRFVHHFKKHPLNAIVCLLKNTVYYFVCSIKRTCEFFVNVLRCIIRLPRNAACFFKQHWLKQIQEVDQPQPTISPMANIEEEAAKPTETVIYEQTAEILEPLPSSTLSSSESEATTSFTEYTTDYTTTHEESTPSTTLDFTFEESVLSTVEETEVYVEKEVESYTETTYPLDSKYTEYESEFIESTHEQTPENSEIWPVSPSPEPSSPITPQKCISEEEYNILNERLQMTSEEISQLIQRLTIITHKYSSMTINKQDVNSEDYIEKLNSIQTLISRIGSLTASTVIRETPIKSYLTGISPERGSHIVLPLKNRLLYLYDKKFTYCSIEKTDPDGWTLPTPRGNFTYSLQGEALVSHVKLLPSQGQTCTIRNIALSFSNEEGQIFQTEIFRFDREERRLQVFWLPARVKCSTIKVIVYDNYGNDKETCFPGLSLYSVLD